MPLVLKAKEEGLTVLVTDMYPDSLCREYADYYFVVDTTDKEGTLAIAKKFGIDAIATDQTDVAVPTVAFVAEQLGLPGISLEVANNFTNKMLMRRICAVSIPEAVPRFRFFSDVTEAKGCIAEYDGPFVLKPINSQGSKGVLKCDILDEQKVENAFKESKGAGILVEQFISGVEISLECFTVEGETHVLAFAKKTQFPYNECVDKSISYFDDLDVGIKNSVAEINRLIIKSLGLKNGLTHAEYKVSNGKPYLIEIAARGAGSGISGIIIPQITGFDVNQFILDCSLNNKHKGSVVGEQVKYALLEFMEFEPGKVDQISVKRDAIKNAEVFSLNVKPGDVIKNVNDSRDRSGLFIVIDKSVEQVERKAMLLRAAVDITYAS